MLLVVVVVLYLYIVMILFLINFLYNLILFFFGVFVWYVPFRKPVHAASMNIKGDRAESGAPLSFNINPSQIPPQLPEQKRHSFTASSHVSPHLKPVNINQYHRR